MHEIFSEDSISNLKNRIQKFLSASAPIPSRIKTPNNKTISRHRHWTSGSRVLCRRFHCQTYLMLLTGEPSTSHAANSLSPTLKSNWSRKPPSFYRSGNPVNISFHTTIWHHIHITHILNQQPNPDPNVIYLQSEFDRGISILGWMAQWWYTIYVIEFVFHAFPYSKLVLLCLAWNCLEVTCFHWFII